MVINHLRIDGSVCTDKDTLVRHIISYNRDLFTCTHYLHDDQDIPMPTLLQQADDVLLAPVASHADIKDTGFSMDQDSAPGLDGFNGKFFRFAWNIVGEDVSSGIVSFFEAGCLPLGLNSSFMALIPKVKEADRVDLFRSIVLSNFIFKIISKILASRLSIITSRIVLENQFGFINGRWIHDCIEVSSECINCLDRRAYGGNIAFKVDIRKAFDTLS